MPASSKTERSRPGTWYRTRSDRPHPSRGKVKKKSRSAPTVAKTVETRETRQFKQKRAQATYEALLAAAARVFARRGFEGAQTPEIAAEAGVSTGAFYRYFADKRQIFVEMTKYNLEQANAYLMKKLDPSLFRNHDTRHAIDVALDVLLDNRRRDVELERVYLAMSLSDPDIQRLRVEHEQRGLDALTALIETIVPRGGIPSARAAALVIELAALEVSAERVGLRPRLDRGLPDEAVKVALREMLHRYLFPSESGPAPGRRRKK